MARRTAVVLRVSRVSLATRVVLMRLMRADVMVVSAGLMASGTKRCQQTINRYGEGRRTEN